MLLLLLCLWWLKLVGRERGLCPMLAEKGKGRQHLSLWWLKLVGRERELLLMPAGKGKGRRRLSL